VQPPEVPKRVLVADSGDQGGYRDPVVGPVAPQSYRWGTWAYGGRLATVEEAGPGICLEREMTPPGLPFPAYRFG